ncbi:hypothetical protein [Miltoncostaea oceani]|uniref:hypothetical protein n=1 Tax=Miltoncostaea oceani TaxID=2843216 RepID=UPI001C3E5D2F|nr:hypothetical protein [Miltoncostaea oceani]
MSGLRARWDDPAVRQRLTRLLTASVAVVLIAWYGAFALERYDSSHLYGDEPEYFFTGESVWEDGDLDLRNQFLDPDLRAFPGPLTFKVDPAGGPSPANFMPTNGVVLVQPANAVGGVLGVYLLFAAMNLASLLLLFIVLRRTFGEPVAALAILLVGLSVPLAWHAASVWTEVPALLAISGVLAIAPRIGCSARAATVAGLALAALPWLHQKYLPLAVGLAVAVLLPAARRRFWPLVVGGPLLGFAGTVVFSYATRDRWNFTISGSTEEISSAFDGSLNRFLRQPLAWFLDQTRGSIPLSPIWILAGVGLVFLLRFPRGRRIVATLAVAFVPFLVVYFWGPFLAGDSPPGRETLPAIPALAIMLAAGISALRGVLAWTVTAALAAVSLAITMIAPFRLGFDIMFNNVGRPKVLDSLATARFTPADLWPQMTAVPGQWSVSALLMSLIAVLAVGGVIYQASRARAAEGARPWTLAGEPTARLRRAEIADGLRAVRPGAGRRARREAP